MSTLEAQLGVRRSPRQGLLPGALAVIALLMLFFIGRDIVFPAAPKAANITTVAAQLGTVSSVVSGTGNLAPAQQSNVDFAVAGTLTEVDAGVGATISQGQVLAKIDPTQLQDAVTQAQNNVALAQQQLAASGASIQNDESTLASDQSTLSAARTQLQNDQNQYNLDWTAYNENPAFAADAATLKQDQAQYQAAVTADRAAGCMTDFTSSKCVADDAAILAAQTPLTGAQVQVNMDLATVNSDQARITGDQSQVTADTARVTSDQLRVNQDSTLAQQNGILNAEQALQTAQTNLAEATLTAPISGVVLAVNGGVGDAVAGHAVSASATATAAASSSLFVIGNLTSYQVVAPFAETDAAKVSPGQTTSVTFDAVSGLTLPGQVASVAPVSTVTSNVVNYNVTVNLTGTDPRLRDGMTSNVSVTVINTPDVLVVPNSAITTIGSASFVTVLSANGKTQTRTRVVLGAVGDTTTQIASGISNGARLVLPTVTLRTAGTAGSAATRGAGLGGLGGGRFGGGAAGAGG